MVLKWQQISVFSHKPGGVFTQILVCLNPWVSLELQSMLEQRMWFGVKPCL